MVNQKQSQLLDYLIGCSKIQIVRPLGAEEKKYCPALPLIRGFLPLLASAE